MKKRLYKVTNMLRLVKSVTKPAVLRCSSSSSIAAFQYPPRISTRLYHSYPDPNEKPQISSVTHPNIAKQLDKSSDYFKLNSIFRLDKPFPGIAESAGIKDSRIPTTLCTKLPNGISVATQDMPGLMTSFVLAFKAGRLASRDCLFYFTHENN